VFTKTEGLNHRRIYVTQLRDGQGYTHSIDKRRIRILFKSPPYQVLEEHNQQFNRQLIDLYERAERVVALLNQMVLATQAWELTGPDGIQKLFNQLLDEDICDRDQN
jgi:hypothetical protein